MMAEINDLKIVDAGNTGRWPDGMQVTSVNDSGRALEGMLARMYKDISGQINASGTGAAYLIQPFRAITQHQAGNIFVWKAHVVGTGAATIQVGNLAAKPLRRQGGGALTAGVFAADQIVVSAYNSSGDYYECVGVRGGIVSNHLGTYVIASLPVGSSGNTAFASNGRKNGETEGNGSGVMVFHDGSGWRAVDTGAEVSV